MTVAVALGMIAGVGAIGLAAGLRERTASLDAIAAAMYRPVPARSEERTLDDAGPFRHLGETASRWVQSQAFASSPDWARFSQSLAVTDTPLDWFATSVLVAGGVGVLAPLVIGLGLTILGLDLPVVMILAFTVIGAPAGALLPTAALLRRAGQRRRHFRVVVGSFVDLVVLELAGGTGIEGALFAASRVSADWAAHRIARCLITARESGTPSWSALATLGGEVGVNELVELATTLQLAGTEGARVRASLHARSVALRRHEQADEESAANAVTERLFLPGALLLVGFLLFVGYPAFTRIVGGI